MKRIIKAFVEIIIIFGLAYYLYENKESFNSLSALRAYDIFLILILIFLANILRSAQLFCFVLSLDQKISFIQAFTITVGGTLVNYLPMNAGIFFKAKFLKKLNVSYTNFVSLNSVDLIATFISSSLIALISLSMLKMSNKINYIFIYVPLITMVVLSIVVSFFPSKLVGHYDNKIYKTIINYFVSLKKIINNKIVMAFIFSFVLARLLLTSFIILKCFTILGTSISFFGSNFIATSTSLLTIVNITPGGIGVRETIVGAMSTIIGTNFEIGVLVSVIMRICSLIIHIFFGVPSLLYIRKKMNL